MGRPLRPVSLVAVLVAGLATLASFVVLLLVLLTSHSEHSDPPCVYPAPWPVAGFATLLCCVVTSIVYFYSTRMPRTRSGRETQPATSSSSVVRTSRVTTTQTVRTVKSGDGQTVTTIKTSESHSPGYITNVSKCRRHQEHAPPPEVKRIRTTVKRTKISDIITGQADESVSAREVLLRWAQRTTDCYQEVKITDFTSSWRDGLAFNAIIHRNRPELLDFRSLRGRPARENLELAFSIAEREFGVTRLLDPEDVDTPEPDEKSLITYISLLYDVFSEPPSCPPSADGDKLRKVGEYKEMANILYIWIQESIVMLQDHRFPNSLKEIKALLAECTRFRSEEVPPRLREKQRLGHLHREIQKLSKVMTVEIEESLRFDNIEHCWNKMIIANQERDQAIRAEITRQEKLQRLAEKVQRDIKRCQTKLNEVEKRIPEEEKKTQRLHPMDAKSICDQIEAELRVLEDNMKSILKDVQTLHDGQNHQASELHSKTQELHEQWVKIRLIFQTQLLQPLSTRTFKVEERKVTKQRHVVSEQKLVETSKSLQILQDNVESMNTKLNHLKEISYGSDLESIQSCLEHLRNEQKSLDQYKRKLEQCTSQKSQIKEDEYEIYCTLLTQMETVYSQLMATYNKKLIDLTSLLEFAQLVNSELKWMTEKEKTEVSRDWSAKNLNIVAIEQHQETLTTELEKRETQFNKVQRKGEALLAQNHPASKCVETFLSTLQVQWSWLLQLLVCLENHLKYVSAYHQFFNEAHECEQWLKRAEHKLNTTYSKQNFSIDDGERLLKEMQQLRIDLQHYGDIITSLSSRSPTIVPLKQRHQSVSHPITVVAVCTYKQQNIVITQNERCQLLDNSRKAKWKVVTSTGTEGLVPSICFVIPAPNPEAISLAESLQKQYISIVNLGTVKQQRLRQHLIFATIKVVKSWTVIQFRSMEVSQRESILRALNDDAQKLLSEGPQDDPNLKRLQEEMKSCNKLIEDLQQKVLTEESTESEKVPKKGGKKLPELQAALQTSLLEKEKQLRNKLQAPIPSNLDSLENIVIEHKEFETSLRQLESQVFEMKQAFLSLTRKTPVLQAKHDSIVQMWENIWAMSVHYIERLKVIETILHGIEEASQSISTSELQLASHEDMPSEVDALQKVHGQILSLQNDTQSCRHVIDKLNEDINKLKQLTLRIHGSQVSNFDISKFENDVQKITERWKNASAQVVERMRSCEASSGLLTTYRNKMDSENVWITETRVKVNSLKNINSVSSKEAEKELDSAMNLYKSLANKKPSIENTNVVGGRFIREAKHTTQEVHRISTKDQSTEKTRITSKVPVQERQKSPEKYGKEKTVITQNGAAVKLSDKVASKKKPDSHPKEKTQEKQQRLSPTREYPDAKPVESKKVHKIKDGTVEKEIVMEFQKKEVSPQRDISRQSVTHKTTVIKDVSYDVDGRKEVSPQRDISRQSPTHKTTVVKDVSYDVDGRKEVSELHTIATKRYVQTDTFESRTDNQKSEGKMPVTDISPKHSPTRKGFREPKPHSPTQAIEDFPKERSPQREFDDTVPSKKTAPRSNLPVRDTKEISPSDGTQTKRYIHTEVFERKTEETKPEGTRGEKETSRKSTLIKEDQKRERPDSLPKPFTSKTKDLPGDRISPKASSPTRRHEVVTEIHSTMAVGRTIDVEQSKRSPLELSRKVTETQTKQTHSGFTPVEPDVSYTRVVDTVQTEKFVGKDVSHPKQRTPSSPKQKTPSSPKEAERRSESPSKDGKLPLSKSGHIDDKQEVTTEEYTTVVRTKSEVRDTSLKGVRETVKTDKTQKAAPVDSTGKKQPSEKLGQKSPEKSPDRSAPSSIKAGKKTPSTEKPDAKHFKVSETVKEDSSIETKTQTKQTVRETKQERQTQDVQSSKVERPRSPVKSVAPTSPTRPHPKESVIPSTKTTDVSKETKPQRKSPEKVPSRIAEYLPPQKPMSDELTTVTQSVIISQGPSTISTSSTTKKSATTERSCVKEMVGLPKESEQSSNELSALEKQWQIIPQKVDSGDITAITGPSLSKKEFNVTRREVIVTETYTEYRKEYDISQLIGKCVPLNKLIEHNVINPATCELLIPRTNKRFKLQDALSKSVVSSETIVKVISDKEVSLAETIVEEKYKMCMDNISKLVVWVEETELLLAELGLVREDVGQLQHQIKRAKAIKDNLEANQNTIQTCFEQISQLIQQGKDILSKDEIQQLKKDGDILKKRYTVLGEECDKLIRRFSSALEELEKFMVETKNFMQWLSDCQHTLTQKERGLGNLCRLKDSIESFREFANDVIAHQADLRFITMAAQKFMDESKEYLKVLNNFRTNLPRRLPHLEPGESEVKLRVQEITNIYQTLFSRVTKLNESLSNIESKQRFYTECVEKIQTWLSEVQKQSKKLLNEPLAAETKMVQEQLDSTKQLSMELIGQEKTIENVRHASKALLESLSCINVQDADVMSVVSTVSSIEQSYTILVRDITERSDSLQTTLVQSQDIQDGVDQLLKWLEETENAFRNHNKPISALPEKLQEQTIEYKMIQSDINSQKATIETLNRSSQELINSSNQRLAKKIEGKFREINNRFEKLSDKVIKRGEILEEIRISVETYETSVIRFEQWTATIVEKLEGFEMVKTDVSAIDDLISEHHAKKGDFDDVVKACKTVITKKDITDISHIKEKLKTLEQEWKNIGESLLQKKNQAKAQAEQLSSYEALRVKVLEWLSKVENKLENLEPVALDKDVLLQQVQELKPLIKENSDYAPNIQKVNDLGNAYDSITQGEHQRKVGSPLKKSSSAGIPGSPSRKSPPKSRKSPTSPTKSFPTQSPLSSVSSGFSSRRSSVDNLALEDLSPIQQQLLEINNRYSLLGIKLSDRQQEICSLTDEIKEILELLKSLNVFTQTQTKQLPKELTVISKDQTEKNLQALKNIQDKMQERQPDIEHLKMQTNELLKKKPNAAGAPALQSHVNELVTKWSNAIEIIKEQIEFLQQAKDFQDMYTVLLSWLSQKDKMFQVLGPIATEPRMVESQTQQVQVLQDEFGSQQPFLVRFKTIGESLLSRTDNDTVNSKQLRQQTTTILTQWESLSVQLTERQKSLDAAGGVTREFHISITKLQESLQKISDEFDATVEGSADPDDQLKKLINLEDRLENTRHLLADVESICEQLCEILSDSASKTDIKNKMNSLEKHYSTILKKINNRKAELESALKEDKKFFVSCNNIQKWLNEKEDHLSRECRVSAEQNILKQQVQEFEPIYKEVLDKEHEVHLLLSKGTDVVAKISRKPDALQLRSKLEGIKMQWEKIRKIATDRHTRLQICSDNCKKFHCALESFLPWLDANEKKLSSLQHFSFHRTELDKQIREMQTFKNDISKHSQEYDNIRNLGDTLVSCCDSDKEPVKDKMAHLKKRWDRLNQDITTRSHTLDVISQRLTEYYEKVRDIQHSLQRLDDKLASHDALGDAAREPRHLERMKSFLAEADDVHRQLITLKDYVKTLLVEGTTTSHIAHINKEVDTLEKRHEVMSKKLRSQLSDLEKASEILSSFTSKVKAVQTNLNTCEEDLDKMGTIGRDLNTVRAQYAEVKNFIQELTKIKEDLKTIDKVYQKIATQGYNVDSKTCKDQVSNLQRQINRLDERSKTYIADVEKTLKRLEQFYNAYGSVIKELETVVSKERSFKPVGGDVETVRTQQQQFKVLYKQQIEPLKKQIEEVNKTGQGLIQSASSGVNTTGLEHDLEKLNEKWNELKERLNDRERRLDVALLQSGKFQEALAGVQKWLQDTEEMVDNQKAPSADYKVVKAQVQEQKFLKKLLFDRQNSICSLQTMGDNIMEGVEQTEGSELATQLSVLIQRFDQLTTGAEERMDCLGNTIPVARDFQEKLTVFIEWVEVIERRIVTLSTVPTDTDRIKMHLVEHQAIEKDIANHRKSMNELEQLSVSLRNLVGEEEVHVVNERLQEVIDRFETVSKDTQVIGQILDNVSVGLGKFTVKYQSVNSWIDKTLARISPYELLNVYEDKLDEQLNELKKIQEEVSDHERDVQDVIDCGKEIMKHASGDDVIEMKEKLDSLQVKYSDIVNRVKDKLNQAENALPVVENFHTSHDRLIHWMEEAEKSLKTLESTGLSTQETTIQQLQQEMHEYRTVLEKICHIASQLSQLSPGSGAATIETLISQANRRFDSICEQVQRKEERITLCKQRNLEVMNDIDDLLAWFEDIERQLVEAEPLMPELDALKTLLKEQKLLNEEVSSQKGRVRDILATAKKLMRESSTDDLTVIRDKADALKDTCNVVSTLCAERLSALEQAVPLAEHFFETHSELTQWMDEVEAESELLKTPVMNPGQIKRHQEKTKALLQSVNEHKPLVDKLDKTGIALIKLCGEEEGVRIKDIIDSHNSRYSILRQLLRDYQSTLEEALQATSQFSDKLEGMLNALSSTADQLHNAEPISAIPDRIQEQINDNKAVLQDLDKRSTALEAVKKAADDVIVKAGSTDEPAVRDIRQKLDRLNGLWETIQKAARHRGKSLEDALAAAERFWDELNAVMKALKELQESLNAQEPPAVEPNAIQQQQEVLQEIRQEIDQTKPEVDHCRQAGQDLMQLCGEPDKPEVKKHIEDLDSVWENVTTLYVKREQNLIDAMEKAMNFHDTLQNLLEFLDSFEDRFSNLGPVGVDISVVKEQIDSLKDFKLEVDPHMVEIESLNRQAQELMERTSPEQATGIREPLADINRRWDDLLKGIVDRQRGLEKALLRLGQFHHALDELLIWMSKTEKTLDELKPVFGDPQVIEVVLAKHKVLVNDIQAHQSSVDTLNHAGRQLIESNKGSDDANATQTKLSDLNLRWKNLQDRVTDRQRELEDALKEAQAFNREIQDLVAWLNDIDGQLATSKPVGGLPETAKEQLSRFMELYDDLDNNRHKVESVLHQGQSYLDRLSEGSTANLRNNLRVLKQKWDNVLNKANDRKIKLEIALREALEFHESLQSFVDWLTNAEKYLTNLRPVSRVMKTVMEQIESHKAFQKDVGSHREVMVNLDKKGTQLKYFSQKQDVILIKNLLISVQHRWERVVSKAAERTRALDHGYKEAKEFHDSWTDITKWLDEAENNLDNVPRAGNDPSKIKQMLTKHKEFQRTLGAKQSSYDTTMRHGRALKEKCPKADIPVIQEMMDELKKRWNRICTKSVDRQRKLEEALLFSGQFKDAVEALIDWLDKAEATLSENKPVYGDLDTVTGLMDQHKSFEDELNSRTTSIESVRKTATELLKTANPDDRKNISYQLDSLEQKWKTVTFLSDKKRKTLEDAMRQAEKLYKSVHILLEWLSEAEMKLRFIGALPEDEETTQRQIDEHKKFMKELEEQEIRKDDTVNLSQEILNKCHPNGISVIRHWITIIQSRWEEVVVWARQREQRLQDHLISLRNIIQLLEDLLAWLIIAETNLIKLEDEPLPDDLPTLDQLIKEHKLFMDDMTKRQPDVEKVSKAFSAKRQPPQQTTQIPTRDRVTKDRGLRVPTPTTPKMSTPLKQQAEPHIKHPRAKELVEKWRTVWLLAMERKRRLEDRYNYLKEVERIKNFNFDEWRRRFLGWMNNKKSRIMDLFKKIDKNNVGKVTKDDFIQGILKSKFPTSRLEMEHVAEIFDRNKDGFVDHKEYIETLRPEREGRPQTDAEKIHDEVQRQVAKCTCVHRFKVSQVGEGKYRFGESQKLRLVRILRSTVMVRVGGGWVALDEFLVKNDPCRAKGRTNVELREQFVLAEGVSQSMTPFKSKPSSNSSQSSQSATPSFARTGSPAGPITKVRERSERSAPMRKQRTSGPGDTSSDISGTSFSETDSFRSHRLTPPTPSSQRGTGSRPSSRPNSRPPSRAGSDLSAENLEARKSSRQRVPSTGSGSSYQSSGIKGSSTPSRIPSARSEASRGRPK